MPAALLPRDVPPRPLSELAMLLGLSTGRAGPDPLAGPGGPVMVSGVTHDSRRVRPGDLYAALPGSPASRRALLRRRGRRRGGGRAHRPGRQEPGPALRAAGVRGLRSAGPAGRDRVLDLREPVQPADAHRRDRHQRQDQHHLPAGVRPAPGRPRDRAAGRGGDPGGRDRRAEPAHHARGHRPAGAAGRDGAARGDRGRDGGLQPRAGPRPGHGHHLRRRGVHQPVPGSPGLPRQHGRVLRGQGGPVHPGLRPDRRGQHRRRVGPQAGRPGPDPGHHHLRRRGPGRRLARG